jgi:SWI/SNF-related matrix-associated actin-dependent regulator of chromatin subfamily A member 2/4
MKLPPKKDLPDYYELIRKPIDVKKIYQRIEDNRVIMSFFSYTF